MRFPLLLLPLLIAVLCVSAPGYTGAGAQGISDFVIVADETTNESTIYVTDELSHAVYKLAGAQADVRAPKESSLADLKLFYQFPAEATPKGVAYYNGKLLVSDKTSDMVF